MMVVLSTTSALICVWIAITQSAESTAYEQVIFQRIEQKYLANHVFKIKQAGSELECGLHCLADKSCTSVNYKTTGVDKGRCELNDKKAEEISDVDDKVHDPEFRYLAVKERRVSYNNKTYVLFLACYTMHCMGLIG